MACARAAMAQFFAAARRPGRGRVVIGMSSREMIRRAVMAGRDIGFLFRGETRLAANVGRNLALAVPRRRARGQCLGATKKPPRRVACRRSLTKRLVGVRGFEPPASTSRT